MPVMPVSIPPGVVRGATPYDTPGRWYDVNLVRWRQGVLEPIGGWIKQSAANLPLSGTIRKIYRWRDNSSFLRTLLLTTTEIRSFSASNGYVDVSPSGLVSMSADAGLPVGYGVGPYGAETYGTARSSGSELISGLVPVWSIDNWGEDVIACSSSDGRLFYYDVTSPETACSVIGVYAISAASRTSNVATITTSSAHNLTTGDEVAIAGVTDDTFDDASVTVTVTSTTEFTYANTGSDTTSSGGTVTDASVPVGNQFVTVTEERHVMCIGADSQPRRIAWSSREDVTDWDYASTTNTAGFLDLESRTPLVAAAKVKNGIVIFSETEVFAVRYIGQPFVYGATQLEEARLIGPRAFAHDSGVCFFWSRDGFFKTDGNVVEPVPCPVWNYLQECLCPNSITSLVHASDHGSLPEIHWYFPSKGSTVADQFVIYNWLENWWSIGFLTRSAMCPALADKKPLMSDYSGYVWEHDTGWTDGTNGTREGNIYAETSVIRVPPAGEQNVEIKQAMVANGFGTDTVRLSFYTRQTPQGSERTFGPYTLRSDGYCDTRVTGRDVRMRVEALGDSDWSLSEVRLDVSPGARR